MGFFSKLKKIVPIVDKAATLGSEVLPGKAGQIAGDVATGSGAVTSVVQQIQAKAGADLSPEEAQQQATLATAVAVDDHEERVKALEAELAALRASLSGQAGQSGTAGQADTSEPSGASETSGSSGTSATSGPAVTADTSGQAGTTGQDKSEGQA